MRSDHQREGCPDLIPEPEKIQALAQRILVKAGHKLGGTLLAQYLGVSDETLTEWLSGKSVPPAEIVLKCVYAIEPPPYGRDEGAEGKPGAPHE